MTKKTNPSAQARERRRKHVRKTVHGEPERPRLNIFRSEKHIYAQVIDDRKGHTLASASDAEPELKTRLASIKPLERAKVIGETVAQRALGKGVKKVVFDRAGYKYHGRVKALADGARAGGLEF
ncbi:MAG: 50S ribosomal protein L18 [Chloroflexi bacterium]|nr:50S ribosomal protein L18 [Chloroflexota bacterium]